MLVNKVGLPEFTSNTDLTANGHELHRIDGFIIDSHLIMQMCACRPASITHLANHEIFANIIAKPDGDTRQVSIGCDNAKIMLYAHNFAK